MVATPKKFHLRKTTQRKELFMQTCGPLTLGLGSGTRSVLYSWPIFMVLVYKIYYCLFKNQKRRRKESGVDCFLFVTNH